MRAPFQILAIPYRIIDGLPRYCVPHRADCDEWQFLSGGGEDGETPTEAAVREIFEESGVRVAPSELRPLVSTCHIPVEVFHASVRKHWRRDLYVVPEFSFAFPCPEEIALSREHTECLWLSYEDARARLTWDSNKTALYELHCRLTDERRDALRVFAGKTVRILIDRPKGSRHPKHTDIVYGVNYGYLPNVLGGDGEELDVYLLGVDRPATEAEATVIGAIWRKNDAEDKLVAAPAGMRFTKEAVEAAVHFQERFFDSEVEIFEF